jgi:hypothetical protein
MTNESDYLKFRGKCKEAVDELVSKNPKLRAVRGHYWCPIWNSNEQHWWCVDADGTIIDPTAKQFPSAGLGEYTEFNGEVSCDECGCTGKEGDFSFESNYAFCSYICHGRFVGVF